MAVMSAAPLTSIMNNSDATGRVAKWGIELSAFDINYKARNAIKCQVLADFIADWTEAPEGTPMPEPEPWIMHFDVKATSRLRGWRYPQVTYWRGAEICAPNPLYGYK